ncbi:PQQ-dependent sugar dehydrogenase [Indibacter alkaliphilus]|nr:PQQ-dependent sugar dehydrogenase [Indibacter alkaliphilus]
MKMYFSGSIYLPESNGLWVMNRLLPIISVICCLSCSLPQEKEVETPALAYLKLDDSLLEISEIVGGLEVPWDIETAEEGKLWFTELSGKIYRLDLQTQEKVLMLELPDVLSKKSYGLLGMTIDPKSKSAFLHYTFAVPKEGMEEEVNSRLVKYQISGNSLKNPQILMDSLPGATFHNGSRLLIGPDKKLYFSLGDVGKTDLTQNKDFLGGKILRLNQDGSIPPENPYPNNPVWAMGLRNSQGLVFGPNQQLYGSDHGPLNDDEVNLLIKGGNYGWPDVHGFADSEKEKIFAAKHQTIDPLFAWTPTIATAGMAYLGENMIPEWENTLLLVSLKGQSLRVLHLSADGKEIKDEGIFLQKHFGRLRDIALAKNGDIFFGTSNRDWHPRFQPWMYDNLPDGPDRILRIRKISDPSQIDPSLPVLERETEVIPLKDENWNFEVPDGLENGGILYTQHCLTCHGPYGKGAAGLIPPLEETEWVIGDKGKLIRVMLYGLSEPITVNGERYHQEMPAYSHLSDEEIAEILTFIRNSFGNKASAVIPGEVYEERKSGLKSKQ